MYDQQQQNGRGAFGGQGGNPYPTSYPLTPQTPLRNRRPTRMVADFDQTELSSPTLGNPTDQYGMSDGQAVPPKHYGFNEMSPPQTPCYQPLMTNQNPNSVPSGASNMSPPILNPRIPNFAGPSMHEFPGPHYALGGSEYSKSGLRDIHQDHTSSQANNEAIPNLFGSPHANTSTSSTIPETQFWQNRTSKLPVTFPTEAPASISANSITRSGEPSSASQYVGQLPENMDHK